MKEKKKKMVRDREGGRDSDISMRERETNTKMGVGVMGQLSVRCQRNEEKKREKGASGRQRRGKEEKQTERDRGMCGRRKKKKK